MFGFPHWQLKSTSTEAGVVAPDERLPLGRTMVMGVQQRGRHVWRHGADADADKDSIPNPVDSDVGYRCPAVLFSSPAGACPAISAPAPPRLWASSSPQPGFNGRGSAQPGRGLGGIIACGLVIPLIGLVVVKSARAGSNADDASRGDGAPW